MSLFSIIYFLIGYLIFRSKYSWKDIKDGTSYEHSMFIITLIMFLLAWPLFLALFYAKDHWFDKK